jgi:hypothetical protein
VFELPLFHHLRSAILVYYIGSGLAAKRLASSKDQIWSLLLAEEKQSLKSKAQDPFTSRTDKLITIIDCKPLDYGHGEVQGFALFISSE